MTSLVLNNQALFSINLLINKFSKITCIIRIFMYLPLRLNPRGGCQMGSSKPSAEGGVVKVVFLRIYLAHNIFLNRVSCLEL